MGSPCACSSQMCNNCLHLGSPMLLTLPFLVSFICAGSVESGQTAPQPTPRAAPAAAPAKERTGHTDWFANPADIDVIMKERSYEQAVKILKKRHERFATLSANTVRGWYVRKSSRKLTPKNLERLDIACGIRTAAPKPAQGGIVEEAELNTQE
ncbi:hypothetical protein ABPG75_010792 [Micractinium tetrahymenae]